MKEKTVPQKVVKAQKAYEKYQEMALKTITELKELRDNTESEITKTKIQELLSRIKESF